MPDVMDLLRRVPSGVWVALFAAGLWYRFGAPAPQEAAYPLGSEDIQSYPQTYGIKPSDPWDWMCPPLWTGRLTPDCKSHMGYLSPYNPYDDDGPPAVFGSVRGVIQA